MKNKKLMFLCSVFFFFITPLVFSNRVTAQCGIYPNGIFITSDPTPSNGMDTDEDIITITIWWWSFLDPPNVYCNFNVTRFEITIYNADYPLGIEAILVQGYNYTLEDIPLSYTFNLSAFVINRVDQTFGFFIAVWHEVEEGSPYPSYYTWYEVRWNPQPLEPRTIIDIPNYVFIVFPILGLTTMTYYLYWKSTCKNTDNWDDERCMKKRAYIQGKEMEVRQEKEKLSKELFGEPK